jgi:putative membrane protein
MNMNTGWWIVVVVVMVVMMGGMLWMMLGMGSGRGSRSTSDPLEIVRQRYARGEISDEEYERVRRGLEEKT